ncbi:MAG: ATP-binding protein [Chroococcidiopsidaceae cyanobacterium CP_BM_ER_R8_30]|nr:ATP-binding protein [Chroococcidiopsidaceae cyanobacterium CP_BM_ER_R8_30]
MEPLTVVGSLNSLAAIAEYVMAAAEAARLDKKVSYKLRLAVDEIATNIILHSYQEAGRSGVLDLLAEFDEQALIISIEDTGDPYDPTKEPTPTDLDQPLEQRQLGGLGVYLAIHSVDKFIYERVGNKNRNTFFVKYKSKKSQEDESNSQNL